MKKLTILFALLLIGLTAQYGFAQTNTDKENLIKIVRFLEEKPLDENAKKYREWGFLYVAQTKDVSVKVCTDIIKPLMDKKFKYASELTIHNTLALAAFKLENSAKANDEIAVQTAGLESALKAYEAIVKEKPKAQFAALDALVEKRNKNELAAYITENNCK